MTTYHNPVLLAETVDGLNIRPEGTYADLTFGGGGHSRAILEKLTSGKLIAFDQDPDAKRNLPQDDRLIFVDHNFRYLQNFLKYNDALPVDGVLADLGISSHQIDEAERGFSIRFDADMDMRMSQDGDLDAIALINEYDEKTLADMLFVNSDMRNGRQIARSIVGYRSGNDIRTTNNLKEAIASHLPKGKENTVLAKIFQAIRIEVNDELGALQEMLEQLQTVVKPGGRISIISYHSLEDRMVKNLIRSGNTKAKKDETDLFGNAKLPFKAINKKPITPSADEIAANPRARSAKLRIAERQ